MNKTFLMMSEKVKNNFGYNSANDPRCLSCKMKHCFQCEHWPKEMPPRRKKKAQPIYQAPAPVEQKKESCCGCCF